MNVADIVAVVEAMSSIDEIEKALRAEGLDLTYQPGRSLGWNATVIRRHDGGHQVLGSAEHTNKPTAALLALIDARTSPVYKPI